MDQRWVELRVHGVSGTPPGSMLDRPHVLQTGGDDESRYFRSVDAAGEELPGHDGQVLEAYHWGRLTSGSRVNALWLFLLPFGMVNAAHYMLPAPVAGRRLRLQLGLHAICDGLIRFIGLLLTSMYAFAAGLVFIDLIGWRWASGNELLQTLDGGWVPAIAVLLSAAVVRLLAYLARGYGETRFARFLARRRGDAPASEPQPARPGYTSTPLAHESFYSGDSRTDELTDLHIAAGVLTVSMMAVWVAEPDAWTAATREGWIPVPPDGWQWLHGPTTLVYAVALWALVALLVLVFGDPERGTRTWNADQKWVGRSWSAATRVLAPLLRIASTAVLAMAVVTVLVASTSPSAARPTSFDLIANYLLVIGVAALAALVAANLLFVVAGGYRRAEKGQPERHFAPYAFGHAAAAVTLTGTFLGVGLAAAVATGVSSLLRLAEPAAPRSTSAAGDVAVGTTPMLDRVAYGWGLNLGLLLALLLLAVALTMWPSKRHLLEQRLATVYDVDGTSALPARWVRKVRRAAGVAHLKNHVGFFVTAFAGIGLLFSCVVAYELTGCLNDSTAPCREAPGPLNHLSQPKYTLDDTGTPSANFIGLVGAWLVLAAAGFLLLQSRKALKAEDKRRTLNVIWDVLAFWPHATHPFSPRPYSKRCVQDLGKRITHHLDMTAAADGKARDLVLCGHSQGSLISFAALLRLKPEHRDRVALVTFGSQLRVIFPRAFPAYVNYPTIKALYDDLGGAWINLYRLTDPIAGPVLSWGHADGPPRSYHFPAPGSWCADWSPGPGADALDDSRTLKCGADWQLADPVPADPDLQTGAVAELLRHSWFPRHPQWGRCLDLIRETPPPPRDGQPEVAPVVQRSVADAVPLPDPPLPDPTLG